MYHLHLMAHQIYEERIREAERQARFLAACAMLTAACPPVVAAPVAPPLRRLRGLLQQVRRTPAL